MSDILIPKTPGEVAKAIQFSVVGVLAALIPITADGKVTQPEIIMLVLAVLGLAGVYWFGGKAKMVTAFATAAAQALALIVTDTTGFAHVSLNQWLVVIVTAAAAIGVGIVPNSPPVAQVELAYEPKHSAETEIEPTGGYEVGGTAYSTTETPEPRSNL